MPDWLVGPRAQTIAWVLGGITLCAVAVVIVIGGSAFRPDILHGVPDGYVPIHVVSRFQGVQIRYVTPGAAFLYRLASNAIPFTAFPAGAVWLATKSR